MNKLYSAYKEQYDRMMSGQDIDQSRFDDLNAQYKALYDNLHDYEGDNFVKSAYDYYRAGKYNPGERGYNQSVIAQGEAILSDKAVQEWLKTKKPYSGRGFSKGGKIHIKPENRGKFTALKKRTGHSASWFKAHGTPAQKKMAVFELNSRKWKHAHGGIKF